MKFKLLESVLTSFGDIFLYENPSTKELNSKEDSKWNRGIIDKQGNLYIEAKWIKNEEEYQESLNDYIYSGLTHSDVLEYLHNVNKFKNVGMDWWKDPESLNYAVFVQRSRDTLDFYLAESYDVLYMGEAIDQKIGKFFKLAKKKNPHLNFYSDRIQEYQEYGEE